MSDVTAELARERLEIEQRQVMNLFERMMKDKAGFLEFWAEATSLVTRIVAATGTRTELKRDLHTLKGNCGLFGLTTVAEHCHALETALEDAAGCSAADLAALGATWSHVGVSVQTLIGERPASSIEVEDAEYEEILRAVLSGTAHTELADIIASWRFEPTRKRLARIAEQAKLLARRLNKGDVEIHMDPQNVRLDPKAWASFWQSFAHVMRNAVDHGIEVSEKRLEHGKSANGTLTLRTRIDADQLIIELSDDGQGIDWAAVRAKAKSVGLRHETQSDLEEALFADGLTTRHEVSETSGRGVGMGAVRQECTKRGGEMSVVSEAGKGTTFHFAFPAASTGTRRAHRTSTHHRSARLPVINKLTH